MMIMTTENELITKISKESKLNEKEILEKIKEKELEYSGLVSRIGAIYIVGRELGVDLIKPTDKTLKINNIVADMNKVEFMGKVIFKSEVKTFTNKTGDGKVANIILGDETGTIRLSLWNEKTEAITKINIGDILEILQAYTKKDYRGNSEVRLSKYGNIRKVDDVEIEVIKTDNSNNNNGYVAATLDKINENDFVKFKAHIIQIYERTMIHYLCPTCKKKIHAGSCEVHGSVEPEKLLVVLLQVVEAQYFEQFEVVVFVLVEIERLPDRKKVTGFVSKAEALNDAKGRLGKLTKRARSATPLPA